jgi:hypothetical protein
MYGVDTIQLANIDSAIVRTNAMIDSCTRHNAPAEAIATLTSRLVEYHNERAAILAGGIKIDQGRLEAKAAMVERILEALDPDQADNVSWWAI